MPARSWIPVLAWAATLPMVSGSPAALAQTDELNEIRAQIEALRAEQRRMAEWQKQAESSIHALEARVVRLAGSAGSAGWATASAEPASKPPPASPSREKTEAPSALSVSGDFRFRAQSDFGGSFSDERKSTQVRGRLGATYAMSPGVRFGARLVTGDPDDPNSTDVQLSNWNDDLQVALDLAYAQVDLGNLALSGGKIPLPFLRTDLVWDGDVNPQGASAVYRHPLSDGSAFRASALLFAIDERSIGDDSTLAGLQMGYDSGPRGDWRYELAGGYYDYRLENLAGADAGDFRSNLRNPDGSYVSDYDLVDVIAGISWQPTAKWPVRLAGDYVRNLGANSGTDTAFGVDLSVGKLSQPGDWRMTYGYSQAEVDAVLAAFSHDNTALPTNYRLHSLTVEYSPMPKATVAGIWYRYSPLDANFSGTLDSEEWLNRLRLYFQLSF